MNIVNAYSSIKNISIFSLIPESFHEAIIESAKVVKITKTSELLKESNIYLLLKNSKIQGTGSDYNLLKGRSLFLDSKDKSDYNFTEGALFLKIERGIFEKTLDQIPSLKKYLSNIQKYPEILKLKRDLKLIGTSQKKIISLLSEIQETSLIQEGQEGQLFIISAGESRINLQDDYLLSLYSTDYLFHSPGISYNNSSDIKFLSLGNIRNLVSDENIELIDLIHQKKFQKENEKEREEKLESLEANHEVEEEDDEFEVSDFKPTKKQLTKNHKKKHIWLKQHDMMDCGAACLTMISKFYGKKINLSTWRSLVHITKEGASMLSLKKAAERVGFDSIGVMSGYKALSTLQVPMIALMEYHFVVIYKIDEKHAWVADPANQMHKIPKENFLKEFSNNALLLKPNKKLKKFPNSKNGFLKYVELFKGSGIRIFEIFLLSLIIFSLNLTTPLFLQFVFDNVLISLDENYLRFIALIFIGVVFLTSVSKKIRGNLIASLTSSLTTKFTSLFILHVFKLPLSYFAVRNVGDITTRLGELEKIRNFFSSKLIVTFINLISLFLYGGILYLYSPRLLLVFLPFIPVFLIILRVVMKKIIINLNDSFKAAGKNQSLTFEQVNSIETIKNLGALLAARWRWEETLVNQLRLKKKFENLAMFLSAFSSLFKETVQLTLFMTAIYLYFENKLSLGQVIAVNTLAASIISPLIALMQEWDEFTKIGVSIEKVDEIFTSKIEKIDFIKKQGETEVLLGNINYHNISFQYGNEHSPMVLQGVSLSIPRGKTVAFVGSSGSGKTTLAYMINRLYDPTKGNIQIGDRDIQDISLESLRENVAMINQDNSIFAGTFFENITMGDDTPDFNRAVKSAKLSAAHDFIMKKNGGYYYKLGENGAGISGGQKQRLNIARALYRNPEILILDEATSALDSKSEKTIMDSIKARKDKTTIIIAHRLNTIMHAERIYVFHKGMLVEEGTHKELILKKENYYFMFKKQIT